MPEGDTIAYAANRMRPVLEGRVPDEILTPQPRHALDRWPDRLRDRAVRSVDTHGKHLFLRFEGDLVLHSHLGMVGVWGVYGPGRCGRPPGRARAWIVFRAGDHEVVEFDGPLLELMTEGRTRFDQRLAALGPDVLADAFDFPRCSDSGCGRTIRHGRSETHCSTSATSPVSATSGRPRGAGRPESTRGGRSGPWIDRGGGGDHRSGPAADAAVGGRGAARDRSARVRVTRAVRVHAAGGGCGHAGRGTRTERHTGVRDVRAEIVDSAG